MSNNTGCNKTKAGQKDWDVRFWSPLDKTHYLISGKRFDQCRRRLWRVLGWQR